MSASTCHRLVLTVVLAGAAVAGLGLPEAALAADERATRESTILNKQMRRQAPPKTIRKDVKTQVIIDRVRMGDVDAAREAFQSYVRENRTKAEVATVSLHFARELVSTAYKTKVAKDERLLTEALPHLTASIANGTPAEQLKARNVYAAAAMSLGRTDDALAVLDAGYATARTLDDPPVRARYLFQYGQAVERLKSPAESVRYYTEAFEADPAYVRAGKRAFGLALSNAQFAAAADVVKNMVDAGHLELAEASFRPLFISGLGPPGFSGSPSPEPMLDPRGEFTDVVLLLFDLLPASRVSEEEFRRSWRRGIDTSRYWLLELIDPSYKPSRSLQRIYRHRANYLDLVLLGYERELPVMRSRGEARRKYARWVDDLAKPSAYLSATGEMFAANGERERAFALYTTAFWLDTNNLAAALNAANLILAFPEELDPEGERLNAIIAALFRGKGEAYLGGELPKILRFHTVLGTIFSKREQWGDPYNPYTAIFQLEHARSTLRELRHARHPSGAPAPGLHLMLADAYQAVGKGDKAVDSLIDAGREAVAARELELARDVIGRRIPALERSLTGKQKRAVDEIARLLRQA